MNLFSTLLALPVIDPTRVDGHRSNTCGRTDCGYVILIRLYLQIFFEINLTLREISLTRTTSCPTVL